MTLSPMHKPQRVRRVMLIGVSFAVVTVALAVGSTSAVGKSRQQGPLELAVVSNLGGNPVALLAGDVRAFQRFKAASLVAALPLATRGERSYFRVANNAGNDCYGVGPVKPTSYRLGQIRCSAEFPSEARPVLDFTVFHQPSSEPMSTRVFRSEGFAADGVADIALQAGSGELVAVTPVIDNVYSLLGPPDQHITKLLARDATGAVVWAQPFLPVQLPK